MIVLGVGTLLVGAGALLAAVPTWSLVSTILVALKNPHDAVSIYQHIGSTPMARLLPSFQSWLFCKILGMANPFSKAISFHVERYDKSQFVAVLRDEKAIRNPFHCIHAAALVLFAETCSGMAVFAHLTPKDKAIVQELRCKYYKKSRGLIRGVCKFERPVESGECDVVVELSDAKNDLVATCTFHWNIKFNSD